MQEISAPYIEKQWNPSSDLIIRLTLTGSGCQLSVIVASLLQEEAFLTFHLHIVYLYGGHDIYFSLGQRKEQLFNLKDNIGTI